MQRGSKRHHYDVISVNLDGRIMNALLQLISLPAHHHVPHAWALLLWETNSVWLWEPEIASLVRLGGKQQPQSWKPQREPKPQQRLRKAPRAQQSLL